MPFRILLRIAFRNLLQARRRTLLLSLALALVTMLLVILLAFSQGLQDTMIRNVTSQLTGHVNVAGFYKMKAKDAAPMVTKAARVREIVVKNTPELDYLVLRLRGWGKIISETASIQVAIHGITAADEGHFLSAIQLARESDYREGGRALPLGDPKKLSQPSTALIFASQAKRLGVTVGDKISVTVETEQGQANILDMTIVAVAKDSGFMSNFSLYIPNETVAKLYNLSPEATGAVMVYLKDIRDSDEVMQRLREVLTKEGYELMDHEGKAFFEKFETVMGEDWTGQKLDLTTWEDEANWLQWILRAFASVSFVLVSILTVIIAIGIMNAMWIAVRERTREIGTIRAIGLSRRGVLALFMVEAALLGLISTSIGGLFGALLAYGLDQAQITVSIEAVKMLLMSDTLHLSVQAPQVVFASASFTAVSCLATLWPAARAASMQPVKAIGSIG